MTIGKGKRPRDPNQLAKWVVDQSTGQEEAPESSHAHISTPPTPPSDLSQYMATIGRKGGQIGGKRRLTTMTKAQRSEVAAKAAKARWKRSR